LAEFKKCVKGGPFQMYEGTYHGQWFEGKEHGMGVKIYPDYSIYEGYWRNGQHEGMGRLI
jgi:hypothetical protein